MMNKKGLIFTIPALIIILSLIVALLLIGLWAFARYGEFIMKWWWALPVTILLLYFGKPIIAIIKKIFKV